MGRLFGTDGVRGVAGDDLTSRLAMDLAIASAEVLHETGVFGRARAEGRRPVAVVGRDPRASGEFLESAVVAGLAGVGVDVLRLGVIPTPAVAFLTAEKSADLGVMLSASHNPAKDNGIKLFARGGFKLPDAVEDEIEAKLGQPGWTVTGAPSGGFGRVRDDGESRERYLSHLLASLSAAQPDGAARRAAVVEQRADAGIAHDGDADRCLAVDADGQVIDGDQIMAVLALVLKATGRLAGDTVVATVMSNLGFRLAMKNAGITLVETAVGDRYVLEAMRAGNYVFGGEQSGHIIMLEHATTGDGLLTALHLLAAVARERTTLADLAKVMTRYPQVLVNVAGVDKTRVAASPEVAAQVAAATAELGRSGRVLVRPSGTEPAVRVMVEAIDPDRARHLADRLASVIRSAS